MDEESNHHEEEQPAFIQPGERLRIAREKAGLELSGVAAKTRIAERHLAMIEAGKFSSLPARTYALGFTRTYARELGLDDDALVQDVRDVLDAAEPSGQSRADTSFEPGDPSRVPSARLSWAMLVLAAILLVGGFVFYRSFFAPVGELPPITHEEEGATDEAQDAEAGQIAGQQVPAGGAVVFTALEDAIWVKFYDADGQQLMQKQMAKGETYTVPADAKGPQIWTGRPDALAITIGGKAVPPLAEREGIMRDIAVDAEALLARSAPSSTSGSATSAGSSARPAG